MSAPMPAPLAPAPSTAIFLPINLLPNRQPQRSGRDHKFTGGFAQWRRPTIPVLIGYDRSAASGGRPPYFAHDAATILQYPSLTAIFVLDDIHAE
jgi:hypothetical protein